MPEVLIQFMATPARTCYVCLNVTMYDKDVIRLDSVTDKATISHFLVREAASMNFREVHDVDPTVSWEEIPVEFNQVRFIEEFRRRFNSDKGFQRQALQLGVRVEVR